MASKILYTLVYVHRPQQILLGLKKRGLLGVNKWNGFGGKVEPNECILDAAVRELQEECSLIVQKSDLKYIGHLELIFEDEPQVIHDVRVFSTSVFQGNPEESDEMRPKWFHLKEIPFEKMWPDHNLWFPYMLQNKLFYGKFHYQGNVRNVKNKILSYSLDESQSLEALE